MVSTDGRLVEVCIFRFRDSLPEVPLLRRAAGETLYPGVWQNVTGSAHHGESSLTAARRELAEETGLTPLRFWIVPHISIFYDRTRDVVASVPYFAAQVGSEANPVLSEEHDSFEWLSFSEAQGRLVWPAQRQGLKIVYEYIVGGTEASSLSEVPPG
jgi:8-oxo-dGTP pyrophosphatase MutT (NUDIX family)